MKVTCKCHGVSGSCSLITCWQQLAPFRKVGDHLEKRYDDATRVKTTRQGRLRVRRKVNNVPTANDLVFLHRSPNYCHANDTIGSLGKLGFIWRLSLNSVWADFEFAKLKYSLHFSSYNFTMGVGMSFFPAKHKKFPPIYIQDLKFSQ